MTPHLTPEQLDLHLHQPFAPSEPGISPPDSPSASHLQSCALCRDELALLRAGLARFREAVTSLAAAEIHRGDALHLARASKPVRPAAWAVPLAVAALTLAVAVSITHPHLRSLPSPAAASTETATALHSDQPSLSDEALLEAVDRDIAAPIPAALQPLAGPTLRPHAGRAYSNEPSSSIHPSNSIQPRSN